MTFCKNYERTSTLDRCCCCLFAVSLCVWMSFVVFGHISCWRVYCAVLKDDIQEKTWIIRHFWESEDSRRNLITIAKVPVFLSKRNQLSMKRQPTVNSNDILMEKLFPERNISSCARLCASKLLSTGLWAEDTRSKNDVQKKLQA